MPGDTMRNYCEKKRMLVTMTVALSSVSFAMLCTGVLTDYWLHSREQIGEGTTTNGSAAYRIAHSGLWRKCTAFDDTGENIICEAIKYFGETDDEQTDLTQQIVLSIRRATVFPLICIGLLLAGSVICFIGHCNYRHKFLTFIAGILFIFSGLFNLVGIVLYIGSVTQEVGNRKPKEMEENPRFVYNYGISFVLTVTSFVLSEFTGVICIYLYISRHKSALRKVQTRALLQRSHSEADVDAMRRRRQLPESAMSMMSTPATPTGARTVRLASSDAGDMAQAQLPAHQQHSTATPHKPALSINELRPMMGNHTPLMSTSAPRWCPPPPVRFVPPSGSVGIAHPVSWRSLPRTLSQPISNQQPHHVMFEQPPQMQQPPSLIMNNSSSVGYTAPEENSDLTNYGESQPQPRQHRHHHRRSKERRTTTDVTGEHYFGGATVLNPESNNSDQQPQNIAWNNGNGRALASYPMVGAYGGNNMTTNHVGMVTADYFPMTSTTLQQQQQALPAAAFMSSPPPTRSAAVSHSKPKPSSLTATATATMPHQFWRIPPPLSPTDITTNDDLSSTSAIDSSNRPFAAPVSSSTAASYLHTAHDRNARHVYKIKHKQGHHRLVVQQSQQIVDRTTGVGTAGLDFGDSSGDQQGASSAYDPAVYYPRRSQAFQRQQCVELYEPPPILNSSNGAGSLTRTTRLSSLASGGTQQAEKDVASDASKISAQVTHHRRTTPV